MKKILITIIVGVFFLIGMVIAISEISKNKTLSFEKKEIENLEFYGITNPQMSECIKMNANFCKANLKQIANKTLNETGGINKNFEVKYNYCVQYGWNETEQMNTSECVNYYQMDQIEIETNLNNQVEEFLKKLSKIKDKRDSKVDEAVSDKLNFTFNELE